MRDALKNILIRVEIMAEVYPMGDNPKSRWVIMPYHSALRDEKRLGRTWLEMDDGQPIPIDELDEYITLNSAAQLQALATERDAIDGIKLGSVEKFSDSSDLAPSAVTALLDMAKSRAPTGGRHDALAAFLNLGQRAGDLEGMAGGLKSAEVLRVWCPDGSRTAQGWIDEIDRWTEHVRSGRTGRRRGLSYLRAVAGYVLPPLPKQQWAADLPEIVVNERHLREIAADAELALLDANQPPTLFWRGGELVRLVAGDCETRLKPLDAVALKGVLDRVADFVVIVRRIEEGENGAKTTVTDSKAARPPADLAPDLLARAETLRLPILRTLATSPIYTPGGVLISTEGYHPSSGMYLDLRGLILPPLPQVPDALALLSEMLVDFPFSPYAASFAHTLAALLMPFVRPMIDGPTPLHLIEAPTRGSGKGMLSEVIAHVTVGGPAGVMVQPRDGDEFEKRVTSILLEGAAMILLDNVHSLKGEALAAALTSALWRGRRLGKSEMLTLPNGALWLATGNNVRLDDDMPRRIVPIRLDPGVERPEERSDFRHPDLLSWINVHRPALVAACLALVEAWKAAGRPKGLARLGSFESWAATIGGILEVAGVPGFLTGRDGLYETANAEPQEWAALLADLHRRHGLETIGARDFLGAMKTLDLCHDYWEGKLAGSALKRIGRAATQRRDRVFGQYRLRVAGKTSTGNIGYRVEIVGLGGEKTLETPKTLGSRTDIASQTMFSANSSLSETLDVSPVFLGHTVGTPEKHQQQNNVPDEKKGVSGVFDVFSALDSDGKDTVEL